MSELIIWIIDWFVVRCCNTGDLRLLSESVSADCMDGKGPFDKPRSEYQPKSDPCDTFGTPSVVMASKNAWRKPAVPENLKF